MKKKILNRVAKIIKFLVFFPLKLLISLLIWIDWKRRYDGLPIEAWGCLMVTNKIIIVPLHLI